MANVKFFQQINVYAINETGVLIGWASQDMNIGSGNTSFTTEPIYNQSIIPATFSNLAAVWDRGCEQCSSTLNLVYQGGDGQIMYGNLSGTEWLFDQIPISPVLGTGLALDIRFLADGGRDIILYHQTAAGNLSYANYNGTYNSTGKLCSLNENVSFAHAKVLKVLGGCSINFTLFIVFPKTHQ